MVISRVGDELQNTWLDGLTVREGRLPKPCST
jgi:hypothetical protein